MNINLTPEFAAQLERFMRLRSLRSKSQAVRVAVEEGLARALAEVAGPTDYNAWLGVACGAPPNPRPRFSSEDDLWE